MSPETVGQGLTKKNTAACIKREEQGGGLCLRQIICRNVPLGVDVTDFCKGANILDTSTTGRNEAIQLNLKGSGKMFQYAFGGGDGKKIPGVARACLDTFPVFFVFCFCFVVFSLFLHFVGHEA